MRPQIQRPGLIAGPPGRDGKDGAQGPMGLTGSTGQQGPAGTAGPQGQQGAQGPQGNPTTVNRKTGASITLAAADVGALAQASDGSVSPAKIALTGTGSTGDVSGMTAMPPSGNVAFSLGLLLSDNPDAYRLPTDTDDSASFRRALLVRGVVRCTPGRTYTISAVDLSNSQVIEGAGANLKAASGSAYMVRLLNYKPELRNAYIADASGATVSVIIGSSYNARVVNSTIINAQTALSLVNSAGQSSTQVSRPILDNVLIDTFTATGISYGSNVAEINATRVYIDAGTVAGASANTQKPKPNTYGIKGVSTGTTLASGGHLFVNCTTINAQKGWSFTDAQLVKIVNSISDTHSDYGLEILGASQYIDATGLFVGTTRGVYVGGTSLGVSLAHLRTIFTGYIPPFGGSDFFAAPAPYYDLTVDSTAKVTVDAASWAGNKAMSVATGASLLLPGAKLMEFQTATPPAAGSTTYVGQQGFSTSPSPGWVSPFAGVVTDAIINTQDAPGSGQSYTYALLVNSSVVATVLTSSGTSSFGGHPRGINVPVNEGDLITLRIVLSSGAFATQHRGFIRLLAQQ